MSLFAPTSPGGSQPLHINQLPSELLLEVFHFLPSGDLLFGVRPVCRRWRQLALDPALWKRRSIDVTLGNPSFFLKTTSGYRETKEIGAAFRLVPYLRSLHLRVSALHGYFRPSMSAASRSSCAVTELILSLSLATDEDFDAAEAALARQVELGRLERLTLYRVPVDLAERWLRVALGNADLTRISLYLEPSYANETSITAMPTCRTLKSLEMLYICYEADSALLERLIVAHAGTLEYVGITSASDCLSRRVFQLLARCHRLETASIPANCTDAASTYGYLSALPNLKKLTLVVDGDWEHPVPYLPSATQLTELTLPSIMLRTNALDFVAALGSSGLSRLSTLHLGPFESPAAALAELPRLLRGLPLLHSLHLTDSPPSEFIVPGSAFNLREPRLSTVFCGNMKQCSLVPLRDLVRRHPLLHVFVDAERRIWDNNGPTECDRAGLHGPPIRPMMYVCSDMKSLCLFAHGPTDECGCAAHREHSLRCGARCYCRYQMLLV